MPSKLAAFPSLLVEEGVATAEVTKVGKMVQILEVVKAVMWVKTVLSKVERSIATAKKDPLATVKSSRLSRRPRQQSE